VRHRLLRRLRCAGDVQHGLQFLILSAGRGLSGVRRRTDALPPTLLRRRHLPLRPRSLARVRGPQPWRSRLPASPGHQRLWSFQLLRTESLQCRRSLPPCRHLHHRPEQRTLRATLARILHHARLSDPICWQRKSAARGLSLAGGIAPRSSHTRWACNAPSPRDSRLASMTMRLGFPVCVSFGCTRLIRPRARCGMAHDGV